MFDHSCVFFANLAIGTMVTSREETVVEKIKEAAAEQVSVVEHYMSATERSQKRIVWEDFLG